MDNYQDIWLRRRDGKGDGWHSKGEERFFVVDGVFHFFFVWFQQERFKLGADKDLVENDIWGKKEESKEVYEITKEKIYKRRIENYLENNT